MSDHRKCAHVRPREGERSTLEFRGSIAAPGYGQSWECSLCHGDFVVVGDTVMDTRDPDFTPPELSISDII